MPEKVRINKHSSLWYKEVSNEVGPYTLLEVLNTSLGEITLGGIPGSTPVFNTDEEGLFVKIFENDDPPGDSSSFTVSYRAQLNKRHPLTRILLDTQRDLYLQRLWFSCAPVDDRLLWKSLEHWRIKATGGGRGAGKDLVGGNLGSQDNTVDVTVQIEVEVFKTSLSAVTISEVQGINCIAGMSKDNACLGGYPGRNKLIFIGAGASGAPANALYSRNGGGSFAAFGTDPTPFGVNSALTAVQVDFINETQIRVVYGRAGDASTKAEFAYQDFSFSAATLTAANWNTQLIAATANNDAIEAMLWVRKFGRAYIVAAGDMYISTDNFESDPGAALFTGSDAIAQIKVSPEDDVWVVGANDLIKVERSDARGTFVNRVAPSSSAAFGAIAFAEDGAMFAGHGTKIYKSVNEAEDAAGWTELKDFGSSHAVKEIQCKKGSSELLRVAVDDSTPGNGEVWESEDGGNSWRQITEVPNQGYNQAYLFQDIDKMLIVGDASGGTGVVHLLS